MRASTSTSKSSSEKRVLKLFNTLTKTKEVFGPEVGSEVGMYVCGVTAYDFSHIGHARAYVAFDVLFRYLMKLGYKVTYVRNFTDVDDKIINKAKEYKEEEALSDPLKLSAFYCDEFLKDMDDLQCLPPTHQPRVSDNIQPIIDMIETLIQKDCAYCLDDGVYFSVDKFERYGNYLSKRNLTDNRAGERVAADHRKRNLADFALWKSAKPGEIFWPSPWGNGRPGWHIECSAMSAKYLGYSFDIHGGGEDLIFPHHENELVQSCAACDQAKIDYWMHIGFVNFNGDKMSKSTKNYSTIRKVTEKYHPLALRYFLLSVNYGSQIHFSLHQADLASDAIFRVYQTLQDCSDALRPFQENVNDKAKPNSKIVAMLLQFLSVLSPFPYLHKTLQICSDALWAFQENVNEKAKPNSKKTVQTSNAGSNASEKLKDAFEIKMKDDLNVAEILKGSLQNALKSLNNEVNGLKKKQENQKLLAVESVTVLAAAIRDVLEVLGFTTDKEKALVRAEMTEDEVSLEIEKRVMAKKNKDFKESDRIRTELAAKGVSLMDLPNGSMPWSPCVPKSKEGKDEISIDAQAGKDDISSED